MIRLWKSKLSDIDQWVRSGGLLEGDPDRHQEGAAEAWVRKRNPDEALCDAQHRVLKATSPQDRPDACWL